MKTPMCDECGAAYSTHARDCKDAGKPGPANDIQRAVTFTKSADTSSPVEVELQRHREELAEQFNDDVSTERLFQSLGGFWPTKGDEA